MKTVLVHLMKIRISLIQNGRGHCVQHERPIQKADGWRNINEKMLKLRLDPKSMVIIHFKKKTQKRN